jgi:hypothetical protein
MKSSNEYGASPRLSFLGGFAASGNSLGSNGDIISKGDWSGISPVFNGGGNGVEIGGNVILLVLNASDCSLFDKLVFVEEDRSVLFEAESPKLCTF